MPESRELQEYLLVVQKLFSETSDRVLVKSSLAREQQKLFRQIVLATGWQESCWRQFVKNEDKLTPLASSTGDVGLMQVNRTTWRSLYDVKGLSGDISYNGHAGAEILHQYLTRYVIPKKEDNSPVAIESGRPIRLTTPALAVWRAVAACAKARLGKKSTMRSATSSKQ